MDMDCVDEKIDNESNLDDGLDIRSVGDLDGDAKDVQGGGEEDTLDGRDDGGCGGDHDGDVLECGICYEPIQIRGILPSCDHLFCFECIKEWSKRENTCPMCKERFIILTKAKIEGKQSRILSCNEIEEVEDSNQFRNVEVTMDDLNVLGNYRIRNPRSYPPILRTSLLFCSVLHFAFSMMWAIAYVAGFITLAIVLPSRLGHPRANLYLLMYGAGGALFSVFMCLDFLYGVNLYRNARRRNVMQCFCSLFTVVSYFVAGLVGMAILVPIDVILRYDFVIIYIGSGFLFAILLKVIFMLIPSAIYWRAIHRSSCLLCCIPRI